MKFEAHHHGRIHSMNKYQQRITATAVPPTPLHIHRRDVEELRRVDPLVFEVFSCAAKVLIVSGAFELLDFTFLRCVFDEKLGVTLQSFIP